MMKCPADSRQSQQLGVKLLNAYHCFDFARTVGNHISVTYLTYEHSGVWDGGKSVRESRKKWDNTGSVWRGEGKDRQVSRTVYDQSELDLMTSHTQHELSPSPGRAERLSTAHTMTDPA